MSLEPAGEDVSAFYREVKRLMEERGIGSVGDLHQRFMDQEPERIGSARWTFERFSRHVHHEVDTLYAAFIVPLGEALATTDAEEHALWSA